MMSESRSESPADGKVRRLSDAVRRVRIAESERMDAISDLHDAERARLSSLSEALGPVFKEIPVDDDFFVCAIGGGMQPRLWIDPTSHVVIGRDRRTYRFLKDTRLGRVVIRETTELEVMADSVTEYIAERMVERERIQESETLLQRLKTVVPGSGEEPPKPGATGAVAAGAAANGGLPVPQTPPRPAKRIAQVGPLLDETPPPRASRGSTLVWVLVAFLIGMPAGAFAILAYAWMQAAQ